MRNPKAEEIRQAIDGMPGETIADALSILLAEGKEPAAQIAEGNRPELANFAQAVLFLKKNYDFEELDLITTEADLVYVSTGDRRILLTDRTAAAQKNTSASRASASRTTPNPTPPDANSNSGTPPQNPEDTGRFSHLEI